MAKIESYFLNLAGEYRVCSELNKRGVFATVTYGNRKGVDLYAISDRHERALKIEVKTSQHPRFVTNMTRKGLAAAAAPDYWVLFYLRHEGDDTFTERFFILTHAEICTIQSAVNEAYAVKYEAKHGKRPDPTRGVDNVGLADVEAHEGQWSKILNGFQNRTG